MLNSQLRKHGFGSLGGLTSGGSRIFLGAGRGEGANPKVGVFSGGSRIFLRRGHQLIFQIFCRKLHENVPLDPPMLSKDQKILHMEILRSVRSFVG